MEACVCDAPPGWKKRAHLIGRRTLPSHVTGKNKESWSCWKARQERAGGGGASGPEGTAEVTDRHGQSNLRSGVHLQSCHMTSAFPPAGLSGGGGSVQCGVLMYCCPLNPAAKCISALQEKAIFRSGHPLPVCPLSSRWSCDTRDLLFPVSGWRLFTAVYSQHGSSG